MSASQPETCLFTTDSPGTIEKKIWNAFTGGQSSIREKKAQGGDPDKCTIYQYFLYLFEESDEKLRERERECRSGEVVCGDCKGILTERVTKFLTEHQKKREKAKDILEEFLLQG